MKKSNSYLGIDITVDDELAVDVLGSDVVAFLFPRGVWGGLGDRRDGGRLPDAIGDVVADGFHKLERGLGPIVQRERFDLGDLHAQGAVQPRALDAHEDAEVAGRPFGVLQGATL